MSKASTTETALEATSEETPPKLVFVSHSSKDKLIARRVAAAVEAGGTGAWIAPRDVTPGIQYGQSIINGINNAKITVLVLSANSNASGPVQREIERASSKGHIIIPFRIEDVLPSEELEFFVSSAHWLDAWEGPLDTHLSTLTTLTKALASGDPAVLKKFRPAPTPPPLADTIPAWLKPLERYVPALAKPATRRQAFMIGGAAAGAALAGAGAFAFWPRIDESALAVLPFENLAADPSLNYLSLAIPAELNSWLAQSTNVIVRPLDAARRLGAPPTERADVARALRVGTLVSGKYWLADGNLNMSIDIIDASRNQIVWTRAAEDLSKDLRSLVDRLLREVQTALSVRLQDEQPTLGTETANAYDPFLQAQALNQDITDQSNTESIRLLRQAIEADPNFARAHALLAETYITRYWWNFSQDREWVRLGDTSAREAVRLAPQSPDAQFALGYAQEVMGRRGDAVRAYFTSLRLGPQSAPALANVARYYFYMGDFARAIETLEALSTIDPTRNISVRKAMCHFFMGDAERAARENAIAERKASGVDQFTLIAFTYSWLRDFRGAERMLGKLQQTDPGAFSIREVQAWLHTMRGQFRQAVPLMNSILTERPEFGIRDEVATLYAIHGDIEKAVPMLEQAVREGAPNYAWYKSTFFRAARNDRRYQAVIASLEQEYREAMIDVRQSSDRRR